MNSEFEDRQVDNVRSFMISQCTDPLIEKDDY